MKKVITIITNNFFMNCTSLSFYLKGKRFAEAEVDKKSIISIKKTNDKNNKLFRAILEFASTSKSFKKLQKDKTFANIYELVIDNDKGVNNFTLRLKK